MTPTALDAISREVRALADLMGALPGEVTNRSLKDRVVQVYRVWSTVGKSSVPDAADNRVVLKLDAELQSLAQLTSKQKSALEYSKRLIRAEGLLFKLMMYLPAATLDREPHVEPGERLFLKGVPDLPIELVPNPILGWKSRLEEFLRKYPYDRSVFIMIRYRERNGQLLGKIKATLARRQLTGIVASDHELTDDLYNPVACLLCCSKGIAVFDQPERRETYNPNVAYELGMVQLLARPSLILKHSSLRTLQTDILMKLYQSYESPRDAATRVKKWAEKFDA